MATDFSYNEKTINSSGPIKPSGINQPLDPRTEVKLYADIKLIPNPYVGMIITVLEDETNSNKMTDYKVLSLKSDDLGVANSVVDRVQRYVEYLGASTSAGGSVSQEEINTAVNNYLTEHPVTGGATAEQAAQIEANKTAIGDASSGLTKEINDINDALTREDAITLNGKKFSNPMTKEEYDSIVNKDENTIYLVDDNNVITGIPDYSDTDANKLLAVNSTGTALAWVDAPNGSGTGITAEQIAQIEANKNAINDRYTKEEVNEIISNISIESGNIKIRDVVNGESFIMSLPIYGDIVVSSENISTEENATTKFTVKLSKRPTNNQVIALSVSNSECSIDKTSLTFTPTNYNQLQEINVTCNHNANSYRDKKSIITLSSLNIDSVTVNVTITNIDDQVYSEIVTGAVFDKVNIKETVNITSTYGFSPEVITNMVNKETNSLDGGSSFTIFAKVGFEQKNGSGNPTVRILNILGADDNNIKSATFERTWKGELHWALYNSKNQEYPTNYDGQITYENGVDMYITFVYDSAIKKMYIYKDADVVSEKGIEVLSGFNSENNVATVNASDVSPIRRLLIYPKALTKEEVLQNINALGGI